MKTLSKVRTTILFILALNICVLFNNTEVYALDASSVTITENAGSGKFEDGTSSKTVNGVLSEDGTYIYMTELPESPTRSGYKFIGWSTSSDSIYKDVHLTLKDSVIYKGDSIFKITKNTTIYAIYKPIVNVTFRANYHYGDAKFPDGTTSKIITTESKDAIIAPDKNNYYWYTMYYSNLYELPEDPVLEGYTFRGWTDNSSNAKEYTHNTSYGNKLYIKDEIVYKTHNFNGIIYGASSTNTAYAVFIPDTAKTITFSAAGGNFSDNSTTVSIDGEFNDDIAFGYVYKSLPEEPTREGYTFKGWFTSTDASYHTDSKRLVLNNGYIYQKSDISSNKPFVNTTANKTVYAGWIKNDTGVTFDANGGTFEDGSTSTKIVGMYDEETAFSYLDQLPSENPKKEGYTFMGWFTYNTTNNCNFNSYMYLDNGKVVQNKNTNYNYRGLGRLTTGTPTEYTFNTNKTVYACWIPNNSTVRVYSGDTSAYFENGTNYITVPVIPVEGAGYAYLPDLPSETPTRDGYSFYTWGYWGTYVNYTFKKQDDKMYYTNSSKTELAVFFPSEINTTSGYLFAASMKAIQYYTFDANGGTFADSSKTTKVLAKQYNYTYITPSGLPEETPVREGYIFAGWTTSKQSDNSAGIISYKMRVENDNVVNNNSAIITSTSVTTYYAAWVTQSTLTIQYNENRPFADGTTEDKVYTLKFDEDASMFYLDEFPENAHKAFAGYKDSTGVYIAYLKDGKAYKNDHTIYYVNGGKNLTATGTAYNSSYDRNILLNTNGGTYEGSTDLYMRCDLQNGYFYFDELPSNPTKLGYAFKGWYIGYDCLDTQKVEMIDGKGYVNGSLYTVAYGDYQYLYAGWQEKTCTVTFNTNSETIIKPVEVKAGATVSKPEDPVKTGYDFVEWQLNSVTFDFSSTISDDITLNAIYEIRKLSVIFDTDGGSTVETQKVVPNNKVTKPINPTKEGFKFSYWTLNGTKFNFSTPITEEIKLKAVWVNVSNPEESSGDEEAEYFVDGDTVIRGTVCPISSLDVTMPLGGLSFIINSDGVIESQGLVIESNTGIPLNVHVLSVDGTEAGNTANGLQPTTINAPTLVPSSKYTYDQWDNLGITDTKQYIAIALKQVDVNDDNTAGTELTNATTDDYKVDIPVELGNLKLNNKIAHIEPVDTNSKYCAINIEKSRNYTNYGKAWDGSQNTVIRYNLCLEFAY